MLTHEQLRHFAQHGWVLEEAVLNSKQVGAYKAALERQAADMQAVVHKDSEEQGQCPVAEMNAAAGSILHFTETLLHAGVPILTDNVRYTMFYGFTPNWYVNWPGSEVPEFVLQSVKNEELRGILGGNSGYSGQHPVI